MDNYSALTPTPPSRIADPRRLLIAATLASLIISFVPMAELLLYPIRMLVTFVHEGSHALITVLTGGVVDHIEINPNGSGLTLSGGGVALFISSAGYVGTTVVGALLLLGLRKPANARALMVTLGAVILVLDVLWTRNAFGFAMGLLVPAILIGMALKMGHAAVSFSAAFVAVQLCLNSLFDVRTLLYLSAYDPNTMTDAGNMASATGIPAPFWAGAWALMSCGILIAALSTFWRHSRVKGTANGHL